jgi:hypothetical protein
VYAAPVAQPPVVPPTKLAPPTTARVTAPAPWLTQPEPAPVIPAAVIRGPSTAAETQPDPVEIETITEAPPIRPTGPIDTPWVDNAPPRTDIETVRPPDDLVKPAAVTGITCSVCQTVNAPTRRFCQSCGAPLVAPAPVVVTRASRRETPSWRWLAILIPILVIAALAGFAIAAALKGVTPAPSASPPAGAGGETGGASASASLPATAHQLKVKSAAARSQLGGKTQPKWAPGKAIDGNPKTSWQEGVDGSVNGQWIEVTFAKPVDVSSITILAGNQAGQPNYNGNERPHHITIRADGGAAQNFELQDVFGAQEIAFSGHVTSKLRLTLVDVYDATPTSLEGSPYTDCAISELRFFGSAS